MKCVYVSCGVIFNGERYLMVQSGEEFYYGKWGFPGGKLQFGETPNDTIIREVEEETGYVIGRLGLFGIYGSEPLPGLWVVSHAYRGEVINGNMKEPDGEEIVNIAWMTYDEIRGLSRDKIRTVDTLRILADSLNSVSINGLERVLDEAIGFKESYEYCKCG